MNDFGRQNLVSAMLTELVKQRNWNVQKEKLEMTRKLIFQITRKALELKGPKTLEDLSKVWAWKQVNW